jgi:hypothetical protein
MGIAFSRLDVAAECRPDLARVWRQHRHEEHLRRSARRPGVNVIKLLSFVADDKA